jgi:hypothetical protein
MVGDLEVEIVSVMYHKTQPKEILTKFLALPMAVDLVKIGALPDWCASVGGIDG